MLCGQGGSRPQALHKAGTQLDGAAYVRQFEGKKQAEYSVCSSRDLFQGIGPLVQVLNTYAQIPSVSVEKQPVGAALPVYALLTGTQIAPL